MRSKTSNPRVTPGNLTIAIVALLICIGIVLVTAMQPKPAPTERAKASLSLTCQEDDPCWDCHEMGNLICGDPEGLRASEAWDTWERADGPRHLPVTTDGGFRVDYVGTAVLSPKVAYNEVALPSIDGLWYVFRSTPN